MKNSKFTRKRKVFAVLLIVSGGLIAGFLPLKNYAAHRADQLMAEADQLGATNPRKVTVNYQVAGFLKPYDRSIPFRLADSLVALNRPDEAIEILKKLPIGESGLKIADIQHRSSLYDEAFMTIDKVLKDRATAEAHVAKSKILLELDRYTDATKAANDARAYNLANEVAIEQQVLSLRLEEKTAEASKTLEAMPKGERTSLLKLAIAQPIVLARVLYDHKLIHSAQRVLRTQPELYLEGNILLARTYMAKENLTEAKNALVKATVAAPANIEAHQLLKSVYERLGDDAGSKQEAEHIRQLEQGSV
jgi:tetratricopeptide (TPR) repeat protein